MAADEAGWAEGPVDVAELHAPFAHQELILADAMGLGDGVSRQSVGRGPGRQPVDVGRTHPHRRGGRRGSGTGSAHRAVAHATSGPCLQQNLVCVLEGD